MKKHYSGTWDSVRTHEVPDWYEDCKFGIFIHWGLYSVPAYAPRTWELGEVPGDETWFCNNPYAEWYYNSVNVGQGPSYEHHKKVYGEDFAYENFADMWKAEKWNPDEWAELFKEAGAGYVVLVTKHHDGFCLFPSEYTDYNSVKRGPKRDITGELTRAVRNQGMRMGTYYSGIIDWRFANDPIYREEDNFDNACPTAAYADYAYLQSKELIDRYEPSVFWNDIGWPRQGVNALPGLLSHYYNTVEEGVVNDRFNGLYHDYTTKEYKYGESTRDEKWEMCRGMGLSFGYNAEEGDDKIISVPDFIRLLVETVSNNGNLLINIGPKADGTIPQEQVKRLKQIGKWLKVNGEGIYGTGCSKRENELHEDVNLFYTRKEDDLFVFADVKEKLPQEIFIKGAKAPEGVIALDENVELTYRTEQEGVYLNILKNESGFRMAGVRIPGGE
jgi:alpha-L-fucosidase